MPIFSTNYPFYKAGEVALLPISTRMNASSQFTGRGVVIAFVDSGFSMHPDLAKRILLHVDATTKTIIEEPLISKTTDMSWHGQMTSVIAAGNGSLSNGKYHGLASDSHLVLIKISSPTYQVKEPDIQRGLDWLVENHQRFNIRIVNISVGGDHVSYSPLHPLHRAIRKLTEAGVVVLTAAGNKGDPELVPPASSPYAITVGGYDDRNSLDSSLWTAYHNNYGTDYAGNQKPEVIAPAAWIASPILPGSIVEKQARWLGPLLHQDTKRAIKQLLEKGHADLGLDNPADSNLHAVLQERIHHYKLIDSHHQYVDGTSVSVAIIASVVAQMLEANPALTPTAVRRILIETAQPLPNIPKERQGAGMVIAKAAVAAALAR